MLITKRKQELPAQFKVLPWAQLAAYCVLVDERPFARMHILGCIQEPVPLSSMSATQNSGATAHPSAAHAYSSVLNCRIHQRL